jgi:two-component sensor histidine kinase
MEIAQPFTLLINELITNSYKHAFNNIENASITINLRHSNNEIIFEYKDNGIGFDVDEKVKNDSIGMNLIQTFISQLDGELVNNTKTGTGCEMIVSIKEF